MSWRRNLWAASAASVMMGLSCVAAAAPPPPAPTYGYAAQTAKQPELAGVVVVPSPEIDLAPTGAALDVAPADGRETFAKDLGLPHEALFLDANGQAMKVEGNGVWRHRKAVVAGAATVAMAVLGGAEKVGWSTVTSVVTDAVKVALHMH